ncbi:MAG: hypothetical protein AB7O32_11135 [Vicinamibacterales bacterium]
MSDAPRRRTRRRRAAAIGAIVAILVLAVLLAPAAAGVLVSLLQVLLRGSLWLATSVVRGDDAWTIAGAIGGALTTALMSPGAMGAAGALLLVGAAALFGLQRLLESEQTTLDSGRRNEPAQIGESDQ